MISYWHWSSIHNSYETYWKGLLSHDFKPNPVYNEAKIIGSELKEIGAEFLNTTKNNNVAFIVSNEALSAVDWFPYKDTIFDKTAEHQYNDVLRSYYDPLYKLNIEADILQVGDPKITNENYDLLIVPMLYSTTNEQLENLNAFVQKGGTILYSFRSGFSDENVKVRTDTQPAIISKSIGAEYSLFVEPDKHYGTDLPTENMTISSSDKFLTIQNEPVQHWAELLTPTTGNTLAKYNHPYWGDYAAITENNFGKGHAFYVGAYLNEKSISELYKYILKKIGLWGPRQEQHFPIINKQLISKDGSYLDFYFNYSNSSSDVIFNSIHGTELTNHFEINEGDKFKLQPWGLQIFKVNQK